MRPPGPRWRRPVLVVPLQPRRLKERMRKQRMPTSSLWVQTVAVQTFTAIKMNRDRLERTHSTCGAVTLNHRQKHLSQNMKPRVLAMTKSDLGEDVWTAAIIATVDFDFHRHRGAPATLQPW